MAGRGSNNNRISIDVDVDIADVNKLASAVEAVFHRSAANEAKYAAISRELRSRNANASEQELNRLTQGTVREVNRRAQAQIRAAQAAQADIRRINAESARAQRQINQQCD